MKIAIIKLGALGDVVRTTVILPALEQKFGSTEVTWITQKGSLPLVKGLDSIDRAVLIEESESAPWRSEQYDCVISLDDEKEACELASSLKTKKLSGAHTNSKGERTYTPDLDEWFGMGVLRSQSDGGLHRANEIKKTNSASHPEIFHRMLGLPPLMEPPTLPIQDKDRNKARAFFDSSQTKKRVGLNTGAGGRWKFKSWGEDQTAQLAQKLITNHTDLEVVLLGGKDETDRNQRIGNQVKASGRLKTAPTDWSLLEFAALVSECDLLVSSDSLAMHLAMATGVKVIPFFGPTSSDEIFLYGPGEKVVTPLECRCCYLKDCDVRPHCMQSIPVERMLQVVEKYL